MAVDNTILVRRGSGTPSYSDFAQYELAYDYTNDKLYIRDGNAMVEVGSSGGGATGDIDGVTAGTGLSGGGTSGTVTLNIDSTVATLTGSQTLTNKTIASPTFTGDILFNDASTPVFTVKDTTNNVQADWRATDTLSVIGTTNDNAFYLKQNGAFQVAINSNQIILNSSGEDRNTLIKDDSGATVFKVDAGTSKTEISTLLLDSVSISAIQTGSESFADNDTSLMTSAAIQDKITSYGYITSDTTLSTEQVQDIAGGMFSSNTETGIAVSYVDGDGTIDLTVDYLPATDDRDVKPSAITTSARKQVRAYFTSLGGLTGTANNDYQDLLVLSTYSDGTGGDVNALAFDKSEQKIRHYLADQSDTTWGTAKVLAYEDTFTAGTGLDLSGTTFSVDVSDFMTNGTNNRVLTATGTDGINGEANLTFTGSHLAVTGTAAVSSVFYGNQINLTGELNFTGAGNKIIDIETLAGSNSLTIRHHNPSGNLFEDALKLTANAGAKLYYNNGLRLETTDAGVQLNDSIKLVLGTNSDFEFYHDDTNAVINNTKGDLQIYNNADDKDIVLLSDDGSGGTTAYLTLDGSSGYTIASKIIRFEDNIKAMFGTSGDLQIQHTGSHSYIQNYNTGNLYINNNVDDADIVFRSDDGSGGLKTYFFLDGSAGNLNFQNNALVALGGIYGNGGNITLYNDTYNFKSATSTDLMKLNTTGLGINTTSPADRLHIYESGNATVRIQGAGGQAVVRYQNDAQSWYAGITAAEQFYWYSSQLGATTNMIHTNGDFYTYYDLLISNNNRALEGRETGGTIRSLIKLNSSNQIEVGSNPAIILKTGGSTRYQIDGSGNHNIYGNTGFSSPMSVQYGAIFNEGGHDSDTRIESDGNANMFRVDASTNRIGIGTGSPAYTLDVSGDIRATGDLRVSDDMVLDVNNNFLYARDASSTLIRVLGLSGSNNFDIGPVDSYAGGYIRYSPAAQTTDHYFYTQGTFRLRVNQSYVYATNKFVVPDGSASAPTLGFMQDANTGFYRPTSDMIGFTTGGSARLLLNSSGPNFINNTGLYMDYRRFFDLQSNSNDRGVWNPIASSIRNSGIQRHFDEEFEEGTNGVNLYNNAGGSNLVVSRITASADSLVPPNKTGKVMKIAYNGNGTTSPNFGGIYQTISSEENHTFVQLFQAKLPDGRYFVINENAQGTRNTSYFLTDHRGTGKWEWYARVSHCGDSGSFGSGGHISVAGGSDAAFNWYIASMTQYDVTESPYNYSVAGKGTSGQLLKADGDGTYSWQSQGGGSNLDADKLDGIQASQFLRSDAADTATGALTLGTQTWNGHITWNNGMNIGVAGESSIDVSGSGYFQVWDSGTGSPFLKCDVGQRVEIGQAGSRGLKVHGDFDPTGTHYVRHGGSDYSPNISFLGGSNVAGSNAYENGTIGYYDNSGTGTMQYGINRGSGTHKFNINGSTVFYVDSGGQGRFIGSTDIGLVVQSSDAGSGIAIKDSNTGGDYYNGIFCATNDLFFKSNNVERMRINSSGNVTIGGHCTLSSGKRFSAHNESSYNKYSMYAGSGSYAIGMFASTGFGAVDSWAMTFTFSDETNRGFLWRKTSHSAGQGAMSLNTEGKLNVAHSVRVGYGISDGTAPGATYGLDVSGSIGATADVVAYISSDKRLKDNIENIANPLEKLNKLNGVEFDWNDKQDLYKGHDIGVIAQEVEEVLPEIVDTREDGHKAVKYDRMVALLIEAVKEQQVQINELKTKLGE